MKPRKRISRAETARIASEYHVTPKPHYAPVVEARVVNRRQRPSTMKRLGVITAEMREVMRAPPNAKANAWNGASVYYIMRESPWRKPL